MHTTGSSREARRLNSDFLDMLSTLSEEGAEYLLVGTYALAWLEKGKCPSRRNEPRQAL